MTGRFRVEVLTSDHDRSSFCCGVAVLDEYLQKRATQDARRRISACYVAVEESTGKIAGFYTLAAGCVLLGDLAESLSKKLPRYPSVPVARVGRLAIDTFFQGQKLGAALLADAAVRAMRSEVAVYALVVDAKDDSVEAFYRHHGFVSFGSAPRQFMMPLRGA